MPGNGDVMGRSSGDLCKPLSQSNGQSGERTTGTARGWAYLKSEALPLAQDDFEAAIREDPRLGDAYNGLGLAEVLRGDFGKGVAHADEALSRGPESTRLV